MNMGGIASQEHSALPQNLGNATAFGVASGRRLSGYLRAEAIRVCESRWPIHPPTKAAISTHST
jgi:hypothetical protein